MAQKPAGTNPEFDELRALFERAMELPTSDREAFVWQKARDPILAEKVLALLAAGDATTTGLAGGVAARLRADAESAGPGAPPAGGRVRSTATSELYARLEQAPRLNPKRYALEGEIARGGMGAIMMLSDRHLNRRLAMKVLLEREAPRNDHEEQLARQLLGRFLEEAQVTSQLDHPGIVPVHELGLDDAGRVYFTMRLVRGRTAGEVFAESKSGSADWPLTRALEVILKVCDAVAFAHEKGVLHRDLKPSNVMVGRFGEVYVMDWGLAKVLGQPDRHDLRIQPRQTTAPSAVDSARKRDADSDDGASVLSMDGQNLGTPSYMPPEQARGEPLDVRADVYAIGAMLYELLGGRPPYTSPGIRIDAYKILRDVGDGPPRRIEDLQKGVPAELVAICDKAMAREQEQRYPNTIALAADLRAFLAQRAVKAYRTGAIVELNLWVRRNRPLAASLAAALLILVAGIVGTMAYANLARTKEMIAHQRAEDNARLAQENSALAMQESAARELAQQREQDANERRNEAKLAADFHSRTLSTLSMELFGDRLMRLLREEVADARRRAGRSDAESSAAQASFDDVCQMVNMTNVARQALREVLFAPAASTIQTDYGATPLLAAMLQSPLAETLLHLGLADQGLELARAARATRARLLPPGDPGILTDTSLVARLELAAGHLAEAEQTFREYQSLCQQTFGSASPQVVEATNGLGNQLREAGHAAEAERLLAENLEVARTSLGADHAQTIICANNLAQAILANGEAKRAAQLMREVRAWISDGDRTPRQRLAVAHNLAVALHQSGQLAEAREVARDSVDEHERIYGDEHPDTLEAANTLALILMDMGEREAAAALLQRVLASSRRALGNQHPHTLTVLNNLGLVLRQSGMPDAAEPHLRESLLGRQSRLTRNHPHTLGTMSLLALALRDMQRFEEAETLYRETLLAQRESLPPNSPDVTNTMNNLGRLLTVLGKYEEARELLTGAVARQREFAGPEDRQTLIYVDNLALLLMDLGETAESERMLREALDIRRQSVGIADPDTLIGLRNLAWLMSGQSRFDEAARLHEEAWTICERELGPSHRETITSGLALAHAKRSASDPGNAESIYRRLLTPCETYQGTQPFLLYCKCGLGWSLLDADKPAEAVKWFEAVLDRPSVPDDVFPVVTDGLVQALQTLQAAEPSDDRAARLEKVRQVRAARLGNGIDSAARR